MTDLLVDRIAKALFRAQLHAGHTELHFAQRWFQDQAARDRAEADAAIAVAVLRAGSAMTKPPAPPGRTLRFTDKPPERGAVSGHPGWFWWEQVQPPAGVTIEYRHTRALHSIHRQPSSISPVSLHGLMWRVVE